MWPTNCRDRKTPHPKQKAMPRNPIPWPLVPGRTAFAIPPRPSTHRTVVPTNSATHTCPSLYEPAIFFFFCKYSHLFLFHLLQPQLLLQKHTILKHLQLSMQLYTWKATKVVPWWLCATLLATKFLTSQQRQTELPVRPRGSFCTLQEDPTLE